MICIRLQISVLNRTRSRARGLLITLSCLIDEYCVYGTSSVEIRVFASNDVSTEDLRASNGSMIKNSEMGRMWEGEVVV